MLRRYVGSHFMFPVQLGTGHASVSDPSEDLYVKLLRRYIAGLVPETYEEDLRSLASVYGNLTVPDYLASSMGQSSDATNHDLHRLQWLSSTKLSNDTPS